MGAEPSRPAARTARRGPREGTAARREEILRAAANTFGQKGYKAGSLADVAAPSGGPARHARVAQTGGLLGFITPLTQHFCGDCNRVRVTAMGMLHTCLGHEDGTDLRSALRASANDDALHAAIDGAIARKPQGHDFRITGREQPVRLVRHMSVTGG